MSRPLELVRFERTTCDDGCCPKWADPDGWTLRERSFYDDTPNPGRIDYAVTKRLTDAELAAEWWKASERVRSCVHPALKVQRANALAKLQALHRFAIHPHYDEADQ